MIPIGWSGFLAFVLFVAPGLVYDLKRSKTDVPEKESTFREISRVVLVSAICSIPAAFLVLLVLQGIQRAGFDQVPTLRELLSTDPVLFEEKLPGTISAVAGFAAVSMFIVWLLGTLRRSRSRASLSSASGWTKVFREHLPEGSIPEVTVRTHDGSLWRGMVANYSADLELEDREIVIAPPFNMQLGTEFERPHPSWSRIVIPAREIEWIAVSYRRDETHAMPVTINESENQATK